MTDPGKLNKQASRGERAKRLFEDELIKGTLEKMEAEISGAWKNSGVDEADVRHNAYLMFQLLERFKACFRQAMAEGEFARRELLRIQKEK